ncbi:hypothetical protein [Streptomyces sp. NPDC047123]|uniref:hypothetical protein n=1 Tax=Streptomyces sp. NPDC047123 TaxID=3155622 RepID=UPI0033DC7DC5
MTARRSTPRIAAATTAGAALALALAAPATAQDTRSAPEGRTAAAAAEHPEAGPLTFASAGVTGAAAGVGVWLLRRRKPRDTGTDHN